VQAQFVLGAVGGAIGTFVVLVALAMRRRHVHEFVPRGVHQCEVPREGGNLSMTAVLSVCVCGAFEEKLVMGKHELTEFMPSPASMVEKLLKEDYVPKKGDNDGGAKRQPGDPSPEAR